VSAAPPAASARRITADVAIQVVSLVGNVALGVAVTAVLARQLGAVEFGEWTTIFSIVGIAGYLADLKIQEITIREIAAKPDDESAWLGALVWLQASIAVAAGLVTAGALLALSHGSDMRIAGVIISVSELTTALSVLGVVFQLRVRNDLAMVVLTFNSLAWAAAVFAIAAAGGGIIAMAGAFTTCTALSAILTVALAHRRATFTLHDARRRGVALARAGIVLGLAGLISLAHSQVDQLLVYELAPHRVDAGLYGSLNRVLIRAMTVPNALMTTLFPLIAAAAASEMARARQLVQTALEYLTMLALPAFGFSLVAAKPLLALLYGHAYLAAAGTFPVVMGSFIVSCWGYVSSNMVIVLGLQRRFVVYIAAGLGLNIALNLLLVPTYGYRAAAWVTVITETVVIGLSMRAVLGDMEMRIRLGRLVRIAGVAALLTGVLFAARAIDGSLAVLAPTALLAYPALLLLTGTLRRDDLRELIAARKT
jgi:O-antigen/teichoic acid export membrane protein